MSTMQSFGDVITSLQTDAAPGQPRPNEMEIAETLFNNLADKYKEKEQPAGAIVLPSSSASTMKNLLKQCLLLTCLVMIFSLPLTKDTIHKFTQKTWLTYLSMFVIAFMIIFIILKWYK